MRRVLPALSLLGLLLFVFWLVLVILPIVFVEVKYQLQTIVRTINPKALFIPDFSGMTIVGNTSKNKDYGIIIPKLALDEKVIFNVDPNDEQAYRLALQQGIAHASSTALPDSKGLGYYFAHSSNPAFKKQYNAIFYLLNKLEINDEIYIFHDQKRYRYLVTSKEIKNPLDTAFLYATYQQETIVLQTCWPPGTTRERLLIFAERQ